VPDVGSDLLGEDHLRSHFLEPGFWPVTAISRGFMAHPFRSWARTVPPKAKDWGNTAHGLQMRIYLDQAATGQSKVPKFKVELRNVGERDVLLNFGIMARNGEQQYATAVSLILV
jgi:hypothetical protein